MLDLIEDYLEDEEDELVDWISKFSESNTSLEGHHSWKVLLKLTWRVRLICQCELHGTNLKHRAYCADSSTFFSMLGTSAMRCCKYFGLANLLWNKQATAPSVLEWQPFQP